VQFDRDVLGRTLERIDLADLRRLSAVVAIAAVVVVAAAAAAGKHQGADNCNPDYALFFCGFLICRSGKAEKFNVGQTLPLGISDCRACVCRPASAGIAAFLTKN
jgi:hypothetical protein